MRTVVFEEAYRRLNPEQKEAVDTIEGPVMVIAGPGTGKTQILTMRIAHILSMTDSSPENILALSFTESGVKAMRERLVSYIGAPAYRVSIYTFHEFSGMLIRSFPEAYEDAVGGHPITDLERISLIESILNTPSIILLRPHGNTKFYVKHVLSALSLMKREYITPDHFGIIIDTQQNELNTIPKIHEKGAHKGKIRGEYIEKEKCVNKNRELLFVYRAYEAELKKQNHFDYDDMIYQTVEAMKGNEDMLRTLQEQYHYILADEHQDVNGTQNRILELLASFHERPNIFVVGDEKQSIYRFQGASLENFLYFEEKFPHTKTIALTTNYRSPQSILDLSHELISIDSGPAMKLRVPLKASRGEGGIIERRSFSHEDIEHGYVIHAIKELIGKGVSKKEIAIIVRTNHEVESFATLLRAQGILTEASADGDILSHPITMSIRTLMRAVVNPQNEQSLFEVLHSGYTHISISDMVKIMSARSYTLSLAEIISDASHLREAGVRDIDVILRLSEVLQETRNRMSVDAPHRVLEYLLQESGFLHFVLSVDPHEGGRIVRRLYDEIEKMVYHKELASFRTIDAMLTTHIEYGLSLNAPYIRTHDQAIQVMTAHKAKGLEFQHVFVPHLVDSRWGGKVHSEYFSIPITKHIRTDEFDSLDDERKLLYVALTRAKDGLYMSYSQTSVEGRSLLPSRFFETMDKSDVSVIDTVQYEESFSPLSELISNQQTISFDSQFLIETLKTRGLSATSLNNYLRDPWTYLYRNILRIPEFQTENAQFGTVLHNTLRTVMKHRREQKTLPNTSVLERYLKQELGRFPFTTEEYVRNHGRALSELTHYLIEIEKTLPYETKEEYKIQVILKTGNPEFPEILLTGMFDRLDFDENGTLLRVVDYKSGKSKTRGYIEGTTKNSNGEYKRQLVFYALLLELQENERLKTRNSLLSFIEHDAQGRIHDEAYTITDAEISELKTEIFRVVQEITRGEFWSLPCDSEKSKYCRLVDNLKRRIV